MKIQSSGKLRIGDVAKLLEVKEFVIRFWEREFKIKARRSSGGQRFYTKQHVALLTQIKDLLYTKEFTIAGAKKHLEEQKELSSQGIAAQEVPSKKILVTAAKLDTVEEKTSSSEVDFAKVVAPIMEQLSHVREKLVMLKELL